MRVSRTDGLPVESVLLRRDELGPRERASRTVVAGIELGSHPPKSEQFLTHHSKSCVDARPFEKARTAPKIVAIYQMRFANIAAETTSLRAANNTLRASVT